MGVHASRNLRGTRLTVAIVGPSTEYVSGSLLRPLNIWYALSSTGLLKPVYIPISSFASLVPQLRSVIAPQTLIVSGVNPWVSAFITLLRRSVHKSAIVDVHGFAWYESSLMHESGFVRRIMLLMCESVAYKTASSVVSASAGLGLLLWKWLRVRATAIPNAVSPLFERTLPFVLPSKGHCREQLLREVSSRPNTILILAPLPTVFAANMKALDELRKVAGQEGVTFLVTGAALEATPGIVFLGYLSFTRYVSTLAAVDAVILPFPSEAICGGARNKLLEAGYCGLPVISTKSGVLFTEATPYTHYIPLEQGTQIAETIEAYADLVAPALHELVLREYDFGRFKTNFISLIVCKSKYLRDMGQ